MEFANDRAQERAAVEIYGDADGVRRAGMSAIAGRTQPDVRWVTLYPLRRRGRWFCTQLSLPPAVQLGMEQAVDSDKARAQ